MVFARVGAAAVSSAVGNGRASVNGWAGLLDSSACSTVGCSAVAYGWADCSSVPTTVGDGYTSIARDEGGAILPLETSKNFSKTFRTQIVMLTVLSGKMTIAF